MRAPDWWSRTDRVSRSIASALSPIGHIYGASIAWKRSHVEPYRSRARVICIGNLTAGGSGKTPVTIAVAHAISAKGLRAFIVTRGYGGNIGRPTLVDPAKHGAREVGDEALLLAEAAPTIVAADRKKGAQLADASGAEAIIMDDGHQNFALTKDISIVVVDAHSGFGNRKLLPAGPLRESVAQGLARADAVVLMGHGSPDLEGYLGDRLRARLVPADNSAFTGKRVVAFAGIGRPNKFFDTLRAQGIELVAAESFPDHHRYSRTELGKLRQLAVDSGAKLMTTEKDFVRLSAQDRSGVHFFPVHAEFADLQSFGRLLEGVRSGAAKVLSR